MSSSSAIAIQVRGLSKEYRIKHKGASISSLADLASSWRSLLSTEERFWALNDASFDVAPGEVVGIIGHNGAGKSTLLKLLSRITEPTKGEAIVNGRLGSLLEVGTGFHPNLTGRENVFLNGSILGMRRREVARQFDAIVDFAGIERFLDTPVKRYSSGMYVRLAFAVAAHLQADVMIVDEVLAVGDVAFQQKCLKKMDDVAGQGRTILLVSHNTAAIGALAKRCLVLKSGQLVFDGATAEALDSYLRAIPMAEGTYVAAPKTDLPNVTRVELNPSGPGHLQQHGQPLEVVVDVTSNAPVDGARVSMRIVDRFGRICAYAWRYDSEGAFGRMAGVTTLRCRFPRLRLAAGRYSIRIMFGERFGGRHFDTVDACPFEVIMPTVREGGWQVDDYAYIEDAEWSETWSER